ncbi:MAG TPA: STAS domain-containing protein [Spirochaetota bacterium]|nr:STAS domain-containing protein [Spirochaetota bacterium]HPJ40011.1 STAS domain-containing protein [Spirochaetota bacterium]HPQ53940.1 STAS domain-containing protein [Spirochaetota bacterium]
MRLHVDAYKDVLVLGISGSLFSENTDELEALWKQILSRNPKTVAIDCFDIAHMDSVAIGVLVKLRNDAHESGITLILLEPNRSVKNLFTISRLEDFFTFSTKSDFEETYSIGT